MTPIPANQEPDFATSIADVISEESANEAACGWKSCSGCHETNEGYETGRYPYSKMFGCFVGSGCSECGGIGVVWEYWSKEGLDKWLADDVIPANQEHGVTEAMVEVGARAAFDAWWADRGPGAELSWLSTKASWINQQRAALTAALAAEPAGKVVDIVPDHCTGTALAFDHGVLQVSKDGSGYIAVDEDHWELEYDRCEGPDGPEGSVHWIVRLGASEMAALRDFLNGAPRAHPPIPIEEIVRVLGSAIDMAARSKDLVEVYQDRAAYRSFERDASALLSRLSASDDAKEGGR